MSVISNFLGMILKFIYDSLTGLGGEPNSISYYAMALLAMAVIQKVLTMPLTLKSTKNTAKMAELRPQEQEIRKKYAKDPQTMQRKIMEFYKENDYNPASGCLPMIVSLVIVFAMLAVIRDPGKYMLDNPDHIANISKNFLWISDITKPDQLIYGMPLLYALSMFGFTAMNEQPVMDEKTKSMNMTMKYMMPIMMFFLVRNWPAGLALYWATGNVIEIIIRLIMKLRLKGMNN